MEDDQGPDTLSFQLVDGNTVEDDDGNVYEAIQFEANSGIITIKDVAAFNYELLVSQGHQIRLDFTVTDNFYVVR